ncbi:MAG: HIT family protein [Candidatus Acidiferrales bacterium]
MHWERSIQRVVKSECAFCAIQDDAANCARVFEDENTFVFLDHRPLFPGHCLLITKRHIATLAELPSSLVHAVFDNVRMIAIAVRNATNTEGTFVAINNVVSQSVPHFHVHIVPRRKGDGLKGFFWPRKKYESDEQAAAVANAIREEIARLKSR